LFSLRPVKVTYVLYRGVGNCPPSGSLFSYLVGHLLASPFFLKGLALPRLLFSPVFILPPTPSFFRGIFFNLCFSTPFLFLTGLVYLLFIATHFRSFFPLFPKFRLLSRAPGSRTKGAEKASPLLHFPRCSYTNWTITSCLLFQDSFFSFIWALVIIHAAPSVRPLITCNF